MVSRRSRGATAGIGDTVFQQDVELEAIVFEPESVEGIVDLLVSNVDTSNEPPTLVEFKLETVDTGTLLRVTESGFDAISPGRREEAYQRNDGGWTGQVKNIEAYVDGFTCLGFWLA